MADRGERLGGAGCRHHWLIEPPRGRHFSPGVCLLCGARRDDFANSFAPTQVYSGPLDRHILPPPCAMPLGEVAKTLNPHAARYRNEARISP